MHGWRGTGCLNHCLTQPVQPTRKISVSQRGAFFDGCQGEFGQSATGPGGTAENSQGQATSPRLADKSCRPWKGIQNAFPGAPARGAGVESPRSPGRPDLCRKRDQGRRPPTADSSLAILFCSSGATKWSKIRYESVALWIQTRKMVVNLDQERMTKK